MKPRILVVDDDETIRVLLSESFAHLDYVIIPADSASEALRLVHQEEFDLMIMDICLPDSNGLELLDLITISHPNLPIIILTGLPQDDRMILEARRKGARDFASKLFSMDQLVGKVQRVLTERKAAS